MPFLNELNISCHLEALTFKIYSSSYLIFSIYFLKLFFISLSIDTISGPLLPPNSGILVPLPLLANCNYPSHISFNSPHLYPNASTYANIELILKSHLRALGYPLFLVLIIIDNLS